MECVMAILNYNDAYRAKNLALKCAEYETIDKIIIVDNKSTDGSMKVLNTLDSKKIIVMESDKNGGFSYGNNIAGKYMYEHFKPEYILYANTDTIFDERNIKECISTMKKYSDLGLISTRMKGPDGKEQLASWNYSTYKNHLLNNFWIYRRRYYVRNQLNEKKYADNFEYTDIVRGSFMLFRMDALKKADFFDSNVFLYAEETIISKRLLRAGYKVGILTNLWYIHNHKENPKANNGSYMALKRMFDSCYYYQCEYGDINVFQKILLRSLNRYGLFEQRIIDFIKSKKKESYK